MTRNINSDYSYVEGRCLQLCQRMINKNDYNVIEGELGITRIMRSEEFSVLQFQKGKINNPKLNNDIERIITLAYSLEKIIEGYNYYVTKHRDNEEHLEVFTKNNKDKIKELVKDFKG